MKAKLVNISQQACKILKDEFKNQYRWEEDLTNVNFCVINRPPFWFVVQETDEKWWEVSTYIRGESESVYIGARTHWYSIDSVVDFIKSVKIPTE